MQIFSSKSISMFIYYKHILIFLYIKKKLVIKLENACARVTAYTFYISTCVRWYLKTIIELKLMCNGCKINFQNTFKLWKPSMKKEKKCKSGGGYTLVDQSQ